MREITVFTHRRPEDTTAALERLAEQAASAGVTLRLDEEETRKHGLQAGPGIEVNAPVKDEVELCMVLGGDGTILRALQRYAGTGVPVFAINFGEIGFLATVEPRDIEDGMRAHWPSSSERRLPRCCACRRRSSLDAQAGGRRRLERWRWATAINDVAIHRKVGERVAELAYALDGEEVGSVRCDGLVVATPRGRRATTWPTAAP